MIKYENDYAIVDGHKFKKDKKTGYYLSGVINGKRIRLHRYIYQKYKGEIPKGYDIHHIDHNKDNNEIENLELLLPKVHKEKLGHEITEEMRVFYRNNLNYKARPKAIEWHKSKEGREWHKKQYEISLRNHNVVKRTHICQNCGKEYETIENGHNKFCSNNCKSAYRRKTGVDDIERKCIKCGAIFKINKYYTRQKCENCKRKKSNKSGQG